MMEAKLEHPTSLEDSYPEPHAQLTTLTAPTTTLLDMAPYSSQAPPVTSSFSLDLHSSSAQQGLPPPPQYYSDFDWQHGAVSAAVAVSAAGDPVVSHHHPGSFYSFAAERPDLAAASVQLYHSFPGTMPHTADLYASSPALWSHTPPALVEESAHASTLGSSQQRYLPALTRAPAGSSLSSPSSSSSSSSSTSTPSSSGKPKRRRVQTTGQRKAANVRERRRMFHLNTAFDELRKRLPAFNYEKRLSRIETLRLAMTYIGFMKDVSMGEDPRKVKLRSGLSDAGSDLSQLDMESCISEDPQHDDLDS